MMPKKNSENSAASHVYEKNRYLAKIVRWLDGDTVELELDLGMSVSVRSKFRLARIDAPETRRYSGVTEEEKARGLELKERLQCDMPNGTQVVVILSKKGKYGRYLIEMWHTDNDGNQYNLNDWLLNEGLVEGVSY